MIAAYLPPISWQVAQAEPIVRSLKNAASEMVMKNQTAVTLSWSDV